MAKKSRSVVLVASPSGVWRRRWTNYLARHFEIHEVGDRAALERAVERLNPSVALLDKALLRGHGAAFLAKLRQLNQSTRIVLLADTVRDKEGIGALKAGAAGYCRKDTQAGLLKKAVDRVQSGEVWLSRKLMASLVEEFYSLSFPSDPSYSGSLQADKLKLLTPRELEVARLVGTGARNKEIGSELGVSEKTVKAHLTAIFQKLDVSDRLGLGLYLSR